MVFLKYIIIILRTLKNDNTFLKSTYVQKIGTYFNIMKIIIDYYYI